MSVADACTPFAHGASRSAWEQAHAAVQADEGLWRLLRLDGLQSDGFGGLFEVRICPRCQSTILRPTSREQAIELCFQLEKLQAQALEALSHPGTGVVLPLSAPAPQPASVLRTPGPISP